MVTSADRIDTFRRHTASTMTATGAGAMTSRAVALSPPEERINRANTASAPSLRSWVNRMVAATIQPSNAHGSSNADVREMYGRT
ncbi:unannotated protein [freshwater metagenome]|uniref:Unannotated protein n=1 Tax=freshwater metagenome TaxID=449393 RepID=A0A6J6EH90_9ZZZZ